MSRTILGVDLSYGRESFTAGDEDEDSTEDSSYLKSSPRRGTVGKKRASRLKTTREKQNGSRGFVTDGVKAEARTRKECLDGDVDSLDSGQSSPLPRYGYVEPEEKNSGEDSIDFDVEDLPDDHGFESKDGVDDGEDSEGTSVSASEIKRRLGIVNPGEPSREPVSMPATTDFDEEVTLEDLQEAFAAAVKGAIGSDENFSLQCSFDDASNVDRMDLSKAIRFTAKAPNLADDVLAQDVILISWPLLCSIAKPYLKEGMALGESMVVASGDDAQTSYAEGQGVDEPETKECTEENVNEFLWEVKEESPDKTNVTDAVSYGSVSPTLSLSQKDGLEESINLSGDEEEEEDDIDKLKGGKERRDVKESDMQVQTKFNLGGVGGMKVDIVRRVSSSFDADAEEVDNLPEVRVSPTVRKIGATVKRYTDCIFETLFCLFSSPPSLSTFSYSITVTVSPTNAQQNRSPPLSPDRPRNREELNALVQRRSLEGTYIPQQDEDKDEDTSSDRLSPEVTLKDTDKRVDDNKYSTFEDMTHARDARKDSMLTGPNISTPESPEVVDVKWVERAKTVGMSSKPPLAPSHSTTLTSTAQQDNLSPSTKTRRDTRSLAYDTNVFTQTHDFTTHFQPPPRSIFAESCGFVIDSWLEKKSNSTGLWIKRYFALSESTEHLCVLLQFQRPVQSIWGPIPLELTKAIPITSIESIHVSSKPREFSLTLNSSDQMIESSRRYGSLPPDLSVCNDNESVNSESAISDSTSKVLKLRALDGEWRLSWITLLQKARSFVRELIRDEG